MGGLCPGYQLDPLCRQTTNYVVSNGKNGVPIRIIHSRSKLSTHQLNSLKKNDPTAQELLKSENIQHFDLEPGETVEIQTEEEGYVTALCKSPGCGNKDLENFPIISKKGKGRVFFVKNNKVCSELMVERRHFMHVQSKSQSTVNKLEIEVRFVPGHCPLKCSEKKSEDQFYGCGGHQYSTVKQDILQ